MRSQGWVALALGFVMLTTGVTWATPIVHVGDKLSITVFNHPELTVQSIVVAADGSIALPLLGAVSVSGRGIDVIGPEIAQRYSTFIRKPAVDLRLIEQAQSIFVTGASVGVLPYLPGETLSAAIGQLREKTAKDNVDLNSTALDLRSVVIERDAKTLIPVNVVELLRSGQAGPALVPGDTIRLASKPIRIEVRGPVKSPGPVYLYADDPLQQAVQLAGGVLPTAANTGVSLVRDGTETAVSVAGAEFAAPAHDGDVITLRQAPHVNVLGMVATPGEAILKNDFTLLSALYLAGGPTKYANVRDVQVVHAGVRRSHDISSLTHGDVSVNVPLSDGDVVFVPESRKIDPSIALQVLSALFRLY